MDDETTVTPTAEEIAAEETTEETAEDVQTEHTAGESAASISEATSEATPEVKKDESVPLSVYLSLKDDMKELKQQIKESNQPQTAAEERKSINAIAEKYPDVDVNFIKDIVSAAKQEAVQEADAKYSPVIQRQEAAQKQAAFDKAFDGIFDKAVKETGVANADKEVIKALALTAQYNNTPITELIQKIYPSTETGRATTENDMRAAGEEIGEIADVENLSEEQRSKILDDPKARKEYFEKLDALGK